MEKHLCAFNFFNLHFQAQPGQSLRLSWKQCKDMPFAMSNNTHSVVLKGKLYMGGGRTSGDSQECTVMVCDIQSGEWSTLPKHQVKSFGMASVNNRLVLVGGLDPSTNKATSQLAVCMGIRIPAVDLPLPSNGHSSSQSCSSHFQ